MPAMFLKNPDGFITFFLEHDQNAFNDIIKIKLKYTRPGDSNENRTRPVFYQKGRRVRQPVDRHRDKEACRSAAGIPRKRTRDIVPFHRARDRPAAAGGKYRDEISDGPGLGQDEWGILRTQRPPGKNLPAGLTDNGNHEFHRRREET